LNPRERIFKIPDPISTHLSKNSATYIVLAATLIILLQYPLVYKPMMSQSLFHKGVMTRSKGEWEASTAYYNRALEYDPVNLRILYRLAFNYAQLNQMEKALETYLRLTSLAPNYSRVQSNLGKIYLQLGDMGLAIDNFREALSMNPYAVDDHVSLAQAYFNNQEPMKSLAELEFASTLEPENESVKTIMTQVVNHIRSQENSDTKTSP